MFGESILTIKFKTNVKIEYRYKLTGAFILFTAWQVINAQINYRKTQHCFIYINNNCRN